MRAFDALGGDGIPLEGEESWQYPENPKPACGRDRLSFWQPMASGSLKVSAA